MSAFERALAEVEERGLLLKQDKTLPSVASLVAGAPVSGSWWGHPRGREIFAVLERLAGHPDVLMAKLVAGKDTFVHRRLWPALLSAANGAEHWQTRGLSPAASALLARVRRAGALEARGEAARELEARLLIRAEQFHTETGAHAKRLETWESWAGRAGVKAAAADPAAGRRRLEEALGAGAWPWSRSAPRASSGFTMTELMIVVAIIGVLSAIALPKFGQLIRKSKEGSTKGGLGAIRSALSIYYGDMEGQFPAALTGLTITAKYLGALPLARTPSYHPDTSLEVDATLGGLGNTGQWLFNNVAADANAGQVLVNCTDTDTKGNVWSAF